MTTLDYRFQVRGGLAAALASLNEVPLRREMIVELDNLFTTGEYKAKICDGTTHYNDLPYLQVGSTGGAGLTAYAGNPLNAGSGTITVPS